MKAFLIMNKSMPTSGGHFLSICKSLTEMGNFFSLDIFCPAEEEQSNFVPPRISSCNHASSLVDWDEVGTRWSM